MKTARTLRTENADLRDRLLIARAQLRAVTHLIRTWPARDSTAEVTDGARFVSICTVNAGRGSFLHALDASGQIWRWDFVDNVFRPHGMARDTGPVPVRPPKAAEATG
jgi:hypothetical protein